MDRAHFAPDRRMFLRAVSFTLTASAVVAPQRALATSADSTTDAARMRALVDWTMLTVQTPHPVPYGAQIFNSSTGQSLMRAVNAVELEHDPSAHGEVHAIRLACAKLQSYSLRGYTLYTTCEPCAMCMACCLWSGLDRVVYGATMADAVRYGGNDIVIPCAEIERRSTLHCAVAGPVEREYCLTLFTNPNMEKVFRKWKST